MSIRLVPRSAVYGQTMEDGTPSRAQQARSMPGVQMMNPHAGAPGTATQDPRLVIQQLRAVAQKIHNDRARIVKEANAKLGALANRVRQLEGFIRTSYAPGAQIPGMPPVDVAVPTHAVRNPNVYTVDGGRGAPPAQSMDPNAGNPHDSAGPPGTAARSHEETVREAQDALFYGRGDAAFYEGGEND